MKKAKNNEKIIIVLAVALILLLGFILYSQSKPSTSTPQQINPSNETKLYLSKNLKFSIEVPANSQIEEKLTSLLIKINGQDIVISRSATNFQNINQYVETLSELNKIIITNKKVGQINGLESISGSIKSLNDPSKNDKTFFIYIDYWVYTISTSSESLFNILDQIARSFRYVP